MGFASFPLTIGYGGVRAVFNCLDTYLQCGWLPREGYPATLLQVILDNTGIYWIILDNTETYWIILEHTG